jgi:hypothetical protein
MVTSSLLSSPNDQRCFRQNHSWVTGQFQESHVVCIWLASQQGLPNKHVGSQSKDQVRICRI